MANVGAVTDSDFEAQVINSKTPVLVDFWAEWCGPCKVIAPILEELAGEYEGKVKIVKINADENVDTTTAHGVSSLPTQILFKDGDELDRMSGPVSKSDIKEKLDAAE